MLVLHFNACEQKLELKTLRQLSNSFERASVPTTLIDFEGGTICSRAIPFNPYLLGRVPLITIPFHCIAHTLRE
jgi:hypothetical protein